MRMFEADQAASARLVKIAYLKLYNRMRIRLAIDLMFHGYAERGIISKRPGQALSENQLSDAAFTEIVVQNRGTQTKIPMEKNQITRDRVLKVSRANKDSKGQDKLDE